MKEHRLIMGMPVSIEIVGGTSEVLESLFRYLESVDEQFSPYKAKSEVSAIHAQKRSIEQYSQAMRDIVTMAQETNQTTGGYFDATTPQGTFDPSGIVKGWAIRETARYARKAGYSDYWIEVGGDIEMSGRDAGGVVWKVGIRNPFNENEIVKVVHLSDRGIATSGTYIRGEHIYNPHTGHSASSDVVSMTVIGPDVYEADRFATAAFAMGNEGIRFIESFPGLEGYAIDKNGRAIMTSGFSAYVDEPIHFTSV